MGNRLFLSAKQVLNCAHRQREMVAISVLRCWEYDEYTDCLRTHTFQCKSVWIGLLFVKTTKQKNTTE